MIIDKFNFKNIINQRITFKDFFENANVNSIEERRIRKSIKGIYLKSVLNQQTTNIRKFEDENYNYSEIFLFEVILDDKNNIRQVEDIFHQTFPNPVIIVFIYKEEYRISIAPKRLSKISKNETVIEDMSYTSFFEINNYLINEYTNKLDYINLNIINLKELYDYYYIWTKFFKVIENFEEIPNLTKGKEYIHLLDNLEEVDHKIDILEERKDKQRQVADKMSLHQEILSFKNKKEIILKEIRENIL